MRLEKAMFPHFFIVDQNLDMRLLKRLWLADFQRAASFCGRRELFDKEKGTLVSGLLALISTELNVAWTKTMRKSFTSKPLSKDSDLPWSKFCTCFQLEHWSDTSSCPLPR